MPHPSAPTTDALVVRAFMRAARGDIAGALAAWRGALEGGASPELVQRALPVMSRVEGRRSWDDQLPRPEPTEPASLAWARAWSGDLEGARRLAEPHPGDPAALGVLGAVLVLERRPEEALAVLDRALALGGGEELVLHRVRALLHLRRFDAAQGALAGLVDGEAFSRRVLKALVNVRCGHQWVTFQTWARTVAVSDAHLNGLFSTELPALVGHAALDDASASPEALAALLEAILDRMAGNLGPSPTFAEVGPNGERYFVRLDLPRVSRDASVDALHSLRHVGPAAAEAALAEVVARYPRSVHARTYRGELYLWLGRYREAWHELAAAHRIEAARWADIGMLAVLVLTDRSRSAAAMALRAERSFEPIPGSTLPVYRGMLRRRTGELDGAIEDLSAALAAKPTRVGARIELCLALRAAGQRAEATEHAATLVCDAAPMLVDAADALGVDWRREPARLVGDDVLEEVLRAMRGNRSSVVVTWIDRADAVRLLEPRHVLQQEARRALSGNRLEMIRVRDRARSPGG
jgi:tetratricopeptide (TPR) repeat protein